MHCFNVLPHLDLDQFSCLFLHSPITNANHVMILNLIVQLCNMNIID